MIPTQLLTLGHTVRVCYDLTNYAELSINSNGDLTIHKLVGGSPQIIDKREGYNISKLHEQNAEYPTDRPLKVGDVLVCKDAMSWFTLGKQYIVKSIEDINFINAICLTNDDYRYEWFSVNKDSIDFWQKYFTLKP